MSCRNTFCILTLSTSQRKEKNRKRSQHKSISVLFDINTIEKMIRKLYEMIEERNFHLFCFGTIQMTELVAVTFKRMELENQRNNQVKGTWTVLISEISILMHRTLLTFCRTIANMDIKLDFVPPSLINFISRQLIGNGFKLYQKVIHFP